LQLHSEAAFCAFLRLAEPFLGATLVVSIRCLFPCLPRAPRLLWFAGVTILRQQLSEQLGRRQGAILFHREAAMRRGSRQPNGRSQTSTPWGCRSVWKLAGLRPRLQGGGLRLRRSVKLFLCYFALDVLAHALIWVCLKQPAHLKLASLDRSIGCRVPAGDCGLEPILEAGLVGFDLDSAPGRTYEAPYGAKAVYFNLSSVRSHGFKFAAPRWQLVSGT